MIKLRLNGQIILGLALSLIWGILFTLFDTGSFFANLGVESTQTGTEHVTPIEITATPERLPFTTLPDVMMVRVRINQESSPEIVRIFQLPEGRLNVSEEGDSMLRVVSESDQLLYEVTFTPNFFFGDPPMEHESIEMIFVLPMFAEAYQLQLITPYGDDYHEFE